MSRDARLNRITSPQQNRRLANAGCVREIVGRRLRKNTSVVAKALARAGRLSDLSIKRLGHRNACSASPKTRRVRVLIWNQYVSLYRSNVQDMWVHAIFQCCKSWCSRAVFARVRYRSISPYATEELICRTISPKPLRTACHLEQRCVLSIWGVA
jgi:hypothetical protein